MWRMHELIKWSSNVWFSWKGMMVDETLLKVVHVNVVEREGAVIV